MAVIKKVAVSNRGEIAKRIIVACHEMGIKTVLLYATGDIDNDAFRLTDESICIGPADPFQSYLNIEKNIQGALGAGAEALHPGYGFLSENPEFAKQCQNKGIIFIGPPPQTISIFGNKIEAKKTVAKAGVPVLPSWTGDFHNELQLIQKAREISYPLMIKASCGGGGRGMRKAHNEEELKQLLPLVRAEALQNFNSEEVFLEKYLGLAQHIEVQFFVSADKEVYILGDRNCSSQRRYQKIIEEAPSNLTYKIKKQMQEACFTLCMALDYQGAGTVEFLVQGENFYFLEINTRLQVEHTVTEMIYGVDLLRAQILTSMGRPVFFENRELKSRGHSIQCRICAEDPNQNFQPSAGKLLSCNWPQGKGIRVDTAYQTGDVISSFYDSLIAKIIVWDDTRVRAIEKMKQALKKTIIFGVSTNTRFLQYVLSHSDFIENKMQISLLEKRPLEEWKKEKCPLPEACLHEIFNECKSTSPTWKARPTHFNPWLDFSKRRK